VNKSGAGFDHADLSVGILQADDASVFSVGLTTAAITATANIDIGAYDLRAATVTADGLTAGRVVFAGTNGVLSSDGDMTFSTDTLTVSKLGAWEATGAINFDSENMTNVDIDSGTIDGTNVTVGSGKTLDVSGGTLTLANNQISGDKVEGGTIAATTITALTISSMAGNWTNAGRTVADAGILTTVDINGGSMDGTTIGAASAAAITCTTLNTGGKLTAGSNEIEGSNFDINGGTVDAITSLTVANSVDIGNYTLTANGLTIDGTFTDGTMTIAGGILTSAVINCGAYSVPA